MSAPVDAELQQFRRSVNCGAVLEGVIGGWKLDARERTKRPAKGSDHRRNHRRATDGGMQPTAPRVTSSTSSSIWTRASTPARSDRWRGDSWVFTPCRPRQKGQGRLPGCGTMGRASPAAGRFGGLDLPDQRARAHGTGPSKTAAAEDIAPIEAFRRPEQCSRTDPARGEFSEHGTQPAAANAPDHARLGNTLYTKKPEDAPMTTAG
jgi:hypothetical protein